MADYTKSIASEPYSDLDSKLFKPSDRESRETKDIESGDLTKQGDSSSRAGDLRESRKNNPEGTNASATPSLREMAMSAKRQEKSNEEKEGEVGGAVAAPMRKGTSSLLRSAWINLVPSWGLTVIWINIHVFLSQVLGSKLFCKLGHEWTDRPGAAAAGGKNQVGKEVGKAIGTFESMGLGCINLGCLMILFAVLALIGLIVEITLNPIRATLRLLGLMD